MNPTEDYHLIGESSVFSAVLEEISKVAPLNKPVLIIGERGTGKELIATRLHYLSQRWEHILLKVNCAALPENLLESDLFGHEVGAFTSASKRHIGRFERADQGSLFLDEISSLSLLAQEKLLRILEYGEFERVGGSQIQHVDVRVIAAANIDLPHFAAQQKFREDLLDRLSFDVITLPPLRARRDDIPQLCDYFALNMVKELKRDYFPGFSEDVMQQLLDYHWPGNARQLKNVVERAVYRTAPEAIVSDIKIDPFESPYRPRPLNTTASTNATSKTIDTSNDLETRLSFSQRIQLLEKQLLREALSECAHNQKRAAQYLGLSYDQFRGQLRKYRMNKTSALHVKNQDSS